MQKSQRNKITMSETDKRYKFTNGPESNSKPTYVVEVGLKTFGAVPILFCDLMTQGGTYASPRLSIRGTN